MGQFLAANEFRPSVFLSSSARRTETTAMILNAHVRGTVYLDEDMYTFDTESLLRALLLQIHQHDFDDVQSLAVVGHNHAISDLVGYLTQYRQTISLPTLGMAELVFKGDWAEVISSPCKLVQSRNPTSKKRA